MRYILIVFIYLLIASSLLIACKNENTSSATIWSEISRVGVLDSNTLHSELLQHGAEDVSSAVGRKNYAGSGEPLSTKWYILKDGTGLVVCSNASGDLVFLELGQPGLGVGKLQWNSQDRVKLSFVDGEEKGTVSNN